MDEGVGAKGAMEQAGGLDVFAKAWWGGEGHLVATLDEVMTDGE